jgi:hypothetical protein
VLIELVELASSADELGAIRADVGALCSHTGQYNQCGTFVYIGTRSALLVLAVWYQPLEVV